jgi:hypothetical protein
MENASEIIINTLYRTESNPVIISRLSKSLKVKARLLEKQLQEVNIAGAGATARDIRELSEMLSELDKKLNMSNN